MYLHLGNETVIRTSEIIGIFELEKTSLSKDTKNFLAQSTKKKRVKNVAPDDPMIIKMPKSYVVCSGEEEKVYISQISTRTLLLRTAWRRNPKSIIFPHAHAQKIEENEERNGKKHGYKR